jgi:hypothetical protein
MSSQKTVTVSDVSVTVKPVKKRNWKNTIIITLVLLLVLCSICGWGAFAAYYQLEKSNPEILYWLKIKERPELLQETTTKPEDKTVTNPSTTTDTEIKTDTPKVQEYSSESGKNLFSLKYTYLTAPQVISNFNIIAPCTQTDCGNIKNEDFTFYKVGTVLTGSVLGKNVAGFDNIVAVDEKQSTASFTPYVRIYVNTDRSQGLVVDTNIQYEMIGFQWIPELTDATASWSIDPTEFGFMNFVTPVYTPSPNYAGGLIVSNIFFSGVKVKYYRAGSFYPKLFSTMSATTEVDKIGDNSVYLGVNGINYIKSQDGFVYQFVYYPEFLVPKDMDDFEIRPQITWSDTTKNTTAYDFYNIGKCGVSGVIIEATTLTTADLVIAGKTNDGLTVYVDKNKDNTYLKKIYNEDYAGTGLNKYNETKEDDITSFTYDQFVAHHPVFYYIDPFGRAIRFVSRDFVMTGGCAKPAIYIYGPQGTVLNVKVVPTGEFRFTLPKYAAGGWDVSTNDSGTLSMVDGEDRGKSVDYLWYESTAGNVVRPEQWMVVDAGNYVSKLEAYLVSAGFNQKEKSDFMAYWQPELAKRIGLNGGKLYVSFLEDGAVNQISQLDVTSLDGNGVGTNSAIGTKRVFMLFSDQLQGDEMLVGSLKGTAISRDGVFVVEWGGGVAE